MLGCGQLITGPQAPSGTLRPPLSTFLGLNVPKIGFGVRGVKGRLSGRRRAGFWSYNQALELSTESVNQQIEADPKSAPMAVAHKLSPRTLRFLNSGTAEGTRVRRRKMAAAVSKKRLSGEYASSIRSTCLYMATTCALASRSTARVVPTRTAGARSTPPQDLQ